MSDTILVASRKGLLTLDAWSGALEDIAFRADPVSAVLDDPRDGSRYAALKLGHFGVKLHRRDPDGAWKEVAVPVLPKGDAEDAPSLEMIWTMETGGADQPGTLWAGTLPAALFRSDDRGESWRIVESLWDLPERPKWFGGGYDHAGIHSLLVDPRDPDRLTIGISCGGIWRSADAGRSWRVAGKGLVADYMPPEQKEDPNIQDPHRLHASAADPDVVWCQHHNGIFRSTDGGDSFERLHAPVSSFGFAVVADPNDPGTAWFAPAEKDERRIPVEQRFIVNRARQGGKAWDSFDEGLPQPPAFDLVYRHAMDISRDGALIAMGSTTGSLWLGEEGGSRWRQLSANLPPIAQVAFGK
ncbi:MAG: hypothetical protein RLO50_10115 [Azospirillaceae bacterium]